MTRAEAILQYLAGLFATACPTVDFRRNETHDVTPSVAGYVNMHDGDPGDPIIDLSPLRYNYRHEILFEVTGFPSTSNTPGAVINAIIGPFGPALILDRSLGGLCDYVMVTAPVIAPLDGDGTDTFPTATFSVFASYATTDPLNS